MSTDDFTEHIGDHGLAGGGGVEYSIRGRENPARTVRTRLREAVREANARYFGEQPDRPTRPNLVTVDYKYGPIKEAVQAVRRVPSFEKNTEGDIAYVVEEAYYPGEYSHYIEVSGVDPERRGMTFMHVQGALAERELTINSVRTDDEGRLTKLHVQRMSWLDQRRKGGDDAR